jgi:hypothetical protein
MKPVTSEEVTPYRRSGRTLDGLHPAGVTFGHPWRADTRTVTELRDLPLTAEVVV